MIGLWVKCGQIILAVRSQVVPEVLQAFPSVLSTGLWSLADGFKKGLS